MAGLFKYLFEGDSLGQLDRFERSGDPKELARIGRNVILAGQVERELTNAAIREQQADMERREQNLRNAEDAHETRIARAEQFEEDRELAIRATLKARQPYQQPTQVGEYDMDSDQGVADFLKGF